MAFFRLNKAVFGVLLALTGQAQAAETLEQAWQAAVQASNALRAEARRVGAAGEQVKAAEAAAGPTLKLEGSWTQLDSTPQARIDLTPMTQGLGPLAARLPSSVDAPLSSNHLGVADARLSLPLYTSGRLQALRDAALSSEDAARQGLTQAEQELRLQVAEAYFNVLRAGHAHDVARQYLASLESYQRDVGNFFRKGVVARGDLLGAEVAVADARQKQIVAAQAKALSRAAYNRLLGRAFTQEVALAEVDWPRETRPRAQLAAMADRQRPELAALARWRDALEANARSVKAEGGPQVGAYAAYSYADNPYLVNKGYGSLGLGVSWTLFDSGLIRARAAGVSEQAQAMADQLQEAKSLVALDVERAASAELESAERVTVAQSALKSADEYLAIQRDRYRNGLANQTEVLAAEARRADSQRNLYNARYDHALAVVRLKRATGEL